MTTRELRLWHFRKVLAYLATANDYARDAQQWEATHKAKCRYSRTMEKNNNRTADFHMAAVEALNACPDCQDTTAFQDHELFPKPHSRKKKK